MLCLTAALSAWGRKEAKSAQAAQTQVQASQEAMSAQTDEKKLVQVSGRVRLVGSMPFSELVISGEDGEWYIAKEDESKLKDLQQRTVAVEGEETVIALVFANGMSAGQRRTLTNIKIISIK